MSTTTTPTTSNLTTHRATANRTTANRTTANRTSIRRIRRLLAAGGLVAVIAMGAAACSDGSGNPKAAGANTAAQGTITTLAPKTGTQAGAVTPQPAQQPTSQPQGQPTSQPTQQPQPNPAPSGPAPVISSFTTPDNIDCHNGNFQNFSASWTTQNAVKVTISIDGPGVYAAYGPNADTSLPFNCSSSHSFLLTAFGADGRTVTKSITLQPRNVQSQGNSDPDA